MVPCRFLRSQLSGDTESGRRGLLNNGGDGGEGGRLRVGARRLGTVTFSEPREVLGYYRAVLKNPQELL